MAKVSGCLCWPKMSQSKTKVPKESSSQLSAAQNSTLTLDPTDGDRRFQSIPKEHDDFIEMLFRPGRPRSRTLLTTSLFPQPQKRRSGDGSGGGGGGGGWFRRRTNSLLSAKRYSLDEDRQLFDTVPATPPPPGGGASFQREFSFTLPLRWTNDDDDDGSRTGSEEAGARGGRAARRSTAVWPEYIWRLSEKRQQQRCLCAGCEDAATTAAAACARVYRHPVRHSDAVAECLDDDEDEDGAEESGLDRRGARGYDRPKSRVSGGVRVEVEPYDVPAAIGSNDWMFFGRGSLRDRSGDWRRRTKSAEFQARPRSSSLEQRAFRNAAAAAAQGRSARGGGGGGEDAPDFPAGSWGRCGHQNQPHYDRPVGLYPLRPAALPGHRRGCHGGGMMALKGSFGLRCFACELKLETMMGEEWNRVEGYHLPGRGGHRSHFAYDAGDSGYIQSDQQETVARSVGADGGGGGASQTLYPELNYVIPSGMFADRKRAICCHDDNGDDAAERDDYLTPLSENFRRFQLERDQSERYLAMSSGVSTRERNEAFSAEETERQKQTTKVPDEIDRQREKESCDEEIRPTSEGKFLASEDEGESDQKPEESTVTSVGKSVRDPVEGEPERKEISDDSVEKVSTLADQEEGNEAKNTATSVDANSPPSSENKEPSGGSVRPKESTPAPPVATRPARSHLDLLHMSPPPQCSFMVDHAYMNVTDSGNETKSAPLKNDGGLEEKRSKQQNVPKNNVDSIEEVAEEIYFASKTKSGNEYLAHWQDVARLNKQPGSQYVMLHKKASSGNNYCHTYLPTLRENLKNSCKTK